MDFALIHNLSIGFGVALSLQNLMYCFVVVLLGTLIGVLVYLIRHWGNYPDAVAFAVLLMNFAAPLLDHYTQPRSYGHDRGRSA